MSRPLIACEISKAAKGDESAFKQLVEKLKINLAWGAYSTFPCQHNPSCPCPTEEEMNQLNDRLQKALMVDNTQENI